MRDSGKTAASAAVHLKNFSAKTGLGDALRAHTPATTPAKNKRAPRPHRYPGFRQLEHFREKWAPVLRRKSDRIKNQEPSFDSTKAGKALPPLRSLPASAPRNARARCTWSSPVALRATISVIS